MVPSAWCKMKFSKPALKLHSADVVFFLHIGAGGKFRSRPYRKNPRENHGLDPRVQKIDLETPGWSQNTPTRSRIIFPTKGTHSEKLCFSSILGPGPLSPRYWGWGGGDRDPGPRTKFTTTHCSTVRTACSTPAIRLLGDTV